MTDAIQIYVGTDRSQSLAVDVLAYSIRRHTEHPVDIHSMLDVEIPEPKDVRQSQRTGFSFARWAIPELAGNKGRAIYLDADMLVFRDIGDLWAVPMDGAKVAVLEADRDTGPNVHYNKNETSVMVLDCDRCDWTLQALVDGLDGRYVYSDLMADLCFLDEGEIARTIPADWNRLEKFTPTTGLLHFTIMPTQPWVSARNPLAHLWINEVRRMITEGALDPAQVKAEIDLGFFRPSLMHEVEQGPMTEPDEGRVRELEAIDQQAGYIPHRSVQEFDRKRAKAVADYERELARADGPLRYAQHVGAEMLVAGRTTASRVKNHLLRR